jgi:hypothetical protein
MTEANEFRQYAKEAVQCASEAKDENEKLNFVELANTWAQAAIASEMIFGSGIISRWWVADEAKRPPH